MFSRLITAFILVFASALNAFAADPYTVAGVHVDATAANALEAQTLAISEGQERAANLLIERMSLESQREEKDFLGVSARDGAKMIRALEISNEKRSASRYLGDITVAFNPAAVAQYMRVHGLTLISTQSRKRLVIPVLDGNTLWDENEWVTAWQDGQFANALTPLSAIGPHEGLDTLIPDRTGANISVRNLRVIGQMFGVEQILIATASPNYQGYTVTLQDIALDSNTRRRFGPMRAYTAQEAVEEVLATLENDWKASVASTASSESVIMPVSVLYRSQLEWQQLQDVINGSAQIRSARLDAISKRGALMFLTYGGDIEQLRNELAFKGVSLIDDENLGMVLARTGAF
ncbi:MAG: hypothetical protein JKY94_00770 [Rhodobacteraceae bacterium]|nr:hypothetical protein [Paracoccaceae bacterium]